MGMEGLILVGTVHLDPDGHAHLLRYLTQTQPKTVTVEVSQYALEYRHTAGPELLARLEPFRQSDGSLPRAMHAVVAQLRPPYEYSAAEAYSERSGALLLPVGDGQLSRQLLDRLERELMVTDNLVTLATRDEPPLAKQVKREWTRARSQHEIGPALDAKAAQRMQTINRRMANQIREASQQAPTVHVGGWEHLKGLGEILKDLKPELRLLRP